MPAQVRRKTSVPTTQTSIPRKDFSPISPPQVRPPQMPSPTPGPSANQPFLDASAYQAEPFGGFRLGGRADPDVSRGSAEFQQSLLGPLGQMFPQGQQLQIRDIPAIEANLNFQNLIQANQDRAQGINILGQAGMALGNDPESVLARELATGFATGEMGPYNPREVQMRESAIREEGAINTQGATRGMREDFAMRGLGGQEPALETALLEQAGRRATQASLGDFAEQVARARAESQLTGLSQLSQLATQQEAMRQAAMQAIAEAYLGTQRSPIDLAALMTRPKKGGAAIGT